MACHPGVGHRNRVVPRQTRLNAIHPLTIPDSLFGRCWYPITGRVVGNYAIECAFLLHNTGLFILMRKIPQILFPTFVFAAMAEGRCTAGLILSTNHSDENQDILLSLSVFSWILWPFEITSPSHYPTAVIVPYP